MNKAVSKVDAPEQMNTPATINIFISSTKIFDPEEIYIVHDKSRSWILS